MALKGSKRAQKWPKTVQKSYRPSLNLGDVDAATERQPIIILSDAFFSDAFLWVFFFVSGCIFFLIKSKNKEKTV